MAKTIPPESKFQITLTDIQSRQDLNRAYQQHDKARKAYGANKVKNTREAMDNAKDALTTILEKLLRHDDGNGALVPKNKYWTFEVRKAGGLAISIWNEPQGRGGLPVRALPLT
jgi:hypothetical protein